MTDASRLRKIADDAHTEVLRRAEAVKQAELDLDRAREEFAKADREAIRAELLEQRP